MSSEILPIVTFDDDILRKPTEEIPGDSPELQALIDAMFATMYNSKGVGLAAPQINSTQRIFITNTDPMTSDDEDEDDIGEMVFINPTITWSSDEKNEMEEGCLSIPDIHDKITRPEKITIEYFDREFNKQELTVDGWVARVIQHEYDHLEGKLFIDYLGSFRRRILRKRLNEIATGAKEVGYPVLPKEG